MNEGELSGRLGLRGWPAVAEEAIIARDCLLAAHVGSPAARLPRLHRRLGRADPLGQGQGLERHRRGHPAPPAADRRAGRDLRPDLQGQPAAAQRRRRRGGPRRPGRRHHRHRRHRPRAAPARGQGLRVGGRRVRHARPGDRALGGAADDGRHRAARLGRRRRADVGQARRDRPAVRPRPPARGGRAGQPRALRPDAPPGWSTRARPRRCRATRRTPAASCPVGWSPRSCAASPPCSTGSSRELPTWHRAFGLARRARLPAMWRGWKRRAQARPAAAGRRAVGRRPAGGSARCGRALLRHDGRRRLARPGRRPRPRRPQHVPDPALGRGDRRGPAGRVVPHPGTPRCAVRGTTRASPAR